MHACMRACARTHTHAHRHTDTSICALCASKLASMRALAGGNSSGPARPRRTIRMVQRAAGIAGPPGAQAPRPVVGSVETCSQPPVTVADHGHGRRVPARLVHRRAAALSRTWRPEPPGPLGGRNTGSIPGRELRGRSRRPGERANALARTRSGTGPRPCCARAARPRMGAPQGGAWRPPPCGAGPGLLTAGGRRFACSLGWLTHRCSPRAALVH